MTRGSGNLKNNLFILLFIVTDTFCFKVCKIVIEAPIHHHNKSIFLMKSFFVLNSRGDFSAIYTHYIPYFMGFPVFLYLHCIGAFAWWSGCVSIFKFECFTKIDTFGQGRPDHFSLKNKAFYSQLFAFQNPTDGS